MCGVLLLGNDKRSEELQKILKKKHITVDYINIEFFNINIVKNKIYEILILPIPTKLGPEGFFLQNKLVHINDIVNRFKDTYIIYASIYDDLIQLNPEKSFNILTDERFTLKNSYLTSIAACDIAFDKNDCEGRVCMVVGLGRIGKYLCEKLFEFGAKIIAVTSKTKFYEDCILFEKCIDYNQISNNINDCDYVFNTAPNNVFDVAELESYTGEYLELASYPYGFIYDVNKVPQSVIMCPSLPGKYYPKEAASIIYESIEKLIF